ncbi:MAG: DinB family protein [bacterium]|nr:DinB family protein [bacterium]
MKDVIKSQFGASLAMLEDAIGKCEEALWLDASYVHPFWRVAYHTVFFADLYLSDSLDAYTPWPEHIDELEFMGPMNHKGGKMPKEGPPYTRDQVEAYLSLTKDKVGPAVDALDPDAESGFFWLSFSKLELQFYNIRHIQHHAGQLAERVRQQRGEGVGWVGMKHE